MLGNRTFNTLIKNRLKDIKGHSLPFGGVGIIAIADLFQLQPVMDGYPFKYLRTNFFLPNLWQGH